MKTKIIKINPQKPNPKIIKMASDLIKRGELVAFPTETVYGLGADAFNPQAIKEIYRVKNRPLDNPSIVHIYDLSQLKKIVKEIPENAKKLIKEFWPGPLTIILKKQKRIPDEVTCGLNSVAVRMPSNKVALELIKNSSPLVAPSANLSGKPSGSNAKAVFQDFNTKIPLILDSGKVQIGLESTVVSFVNKIPILLRPGAISKQQIEKIIGKIKIHPSIQNTEISENKNLKAISPGMKHKHYSPNARVILAYANKTQIKQLKKQLKKQKNKVGIILNKNIEEYARNLFSKMREFDYKKYDIIICQAVDENGLGLALMNRLKRASSQVVRF